MSGLAETNTSTLQEQHTMSDTTKTPKIETVDIRVPVSWVYVYDDILQKGGKLKFDGKIKWICKKDTLKVEK